MSRRSLLKYTKLLTPGARKYLEKLLAIEPIPRIRIYGPYRCEPSQILEKAIKLSSTLRSSLFQEILFKVFWLHLKYMCICSRMKTAGQPCDPCSISLNSLLRARPVFLSTNTTGSSE